MDSISECRIIRFLANIRSLLDDYGKTHAVNSRSSIRVDEDYWYMRGKYVCDKESDKYQIKAVTSCSTRKIDQQETDG